VQGEPAGQQFQVFQEIRRQIEEGIRIEERTEILSRLDALEQAQGTPSFVTRYTEFIAAAANHMTLIAPFIPALTQLLHNIL